jgi:hypothetical protein
MNYSRAIVSGLIVWLCVSVSFYVLEHIPVINKSYNTQIIIIGLLILLYAWIAAGFYYKKGDKTPGLQVGIIISLTAILLDIAITVPLVEIPKGNSYQDFFSSPALWILSILNALTVFFYWKRTVLK